MQASYANSKIRQCDGLAAGIKIRNKEGRFEGNKRESGGGGKSFKASLASFGLLGLILEGPEALRHFKGPGVQRAILTA